MKSYIPARTLYVNFQTVVLPEKIHASSNDINVYIQKKPKWNAPSVVKNLYFICKWNDTGKKHTKISTGIFTLITVVSIYGDPNTCIVVTHSLCYIRKVTLLGGNDTYIENANSTNCCPNWRSSIDNTGVTTCTELVKCAANTNGDILFSRHVTLVKWQRKPCYSS